VVVDDKGSKLGSHPLADGQLQIGRAEACQVRLSDSYASQFHARVFRRDGSWFVEDLGSTNGTYLNQRRVTAPAELRAGDRVKIGKTTLELRR
jgi:pSer/pThr/pTyr-binding forkhead associated (FHA) protein